MAATSESQDGVAQPSASGERRALSPEISHLLVQLSIALHKTATYPAAHPTLENAIQGLTLRLNAVLADRHAISIGVARDRLVIEGGATDPSNGVLRALAEALHRHQIGALRFDRGVSSAEVSTFLATLARDRRNNTTLGSENRTSDERWPHIAVAPIAIDELELSEGDQRATRAERLWLSLAAATLQRDDEELLDSQFGTGELARAIRRNVRDASYDRVIAQYMLQVGQELVDNGSTAQQVALQLGELVSTLGEETLQLLLELGSDLATRNQLLHDLHRVLPASSVVMLTRAAADASKRTISHALLRLFSKLAVNAESKTGDMSAASDAALRDAIGQLVEGWSLADPNPARYRELLHDLSVTGRTGEAHQDPDAFADALRIIEVATESGAVGPAVWRAIDELVEFGRVAELVDVLDKAPSEETVTRVRQYVVKPERLKTILAREHARQAVERVLQWASRDAAEAMLDALEGSASRATRRQIMGRLAAMGGDIAPLIIQRLERGAWYVQRNMLFLLGEMQLPLDFSPGPWLAHEDVRVRREAIRVALRLPSWRDEAILAGLADTDTRMLNLVLGAAAERCPSSIATPLIHMLETVTLSTGIRTLAIRVLGSSREPDARDWLVARVLGKRRWWRSRSLAPKSPDVIAALDVLGQFWLDHPNANRALRLAARSRDAELRIFGQYLVARP